MRTDDLATYAIKETEGMADEKEEVVEIDMDEIKKQIAKSVNETLGKYFK
jgi:tetrahydromethanopterin S-methyltransferase subunit B